MVEIFIEKNIPSQIVRTDLYHAPSKKNESSKKQLLAMMLRYVLLLVQTQEKIINTNASSHNSIAKMYDAKTKFESMLTKEFNKKYETYYKQKASSHTANIISTIINFLLPILEILVSACTLSPVFFVGALVDLGFGVASSLGVFSDSGMCSIDDGTSGGNDKNIFGFKNLNIIGGLVHNIAKAVTEGIAGIINACANKDIVAKNTKELIESIFSAVSKIVIIVAVMAGVGGVSGKIINKAKEEVKAIKKATMNIFKTQLCTTMISSSGLLNNISAVCVDMYMTLSKNKNSEEKKQIILMIVSMVMNIAFSVLSIGLNIKASSNGLKETNQTKLGVWRYKFLKMLMVSSGIGALGQAAGKAVEGIVQFNIGDSEKKLADNKALMKSIETLGDVFDTIQQSLRQGFQSLMNKYMNIMKLSQSIGLEENAVANILANNAY